MSQMPSMAAVMPVVESLCCSSMVRVGVDGGIGFLQLFHHRGDGGGTGDDDACRRRCAAGEGVGVVLTLM